jgi:hypothetical protein
MIVASTIVPVATFSPFAARCRCHHIQPPAPDPAFQARGRSGTPSSRRGLAPAAIDRTNHDHSCLGTPDDRLSALLEDQHPDPAVASGMLLNLGVQVPLHPVKQQRLAPFAWNTCFAISNPIVVTCSMDASFSDSSTPSPWHANAVGGRPPHHPMADLHRGPTGQGGGEMAPILTAEHLVRRLAADSTHVDERRALGIQPEPAAAILRR